MREKVVFIYGVHTTNFGDDLFLKIILERFPSVKFIIHAPSTYKESFKNYSNCILVTDDKKLIIRIKYFCKKLNLPAALFIMLYVLFKYNIKLFLVMGGSIFIDGNSNIPNILRRLKLLRYLTKNFKIFVLGSNFGPMKTKAWINEVRKAINGIDDVCFRDKSSKEIFSDNPNVRFGNDIAMYLSPRIQRVDDKKTVLINIRSVDKWPTLEPNKPNYLNKIKELIERFINDGYYIKLLSFCKDYGDEEITNELYELLRDKTKVTQHYYRGQLEDFLEHFENSAIIVATRFHAIMLGLIYGLRTIPISYSVKSENMLKTYGLWNKIYDYDVFCKASIKDILDSSINNFQIDQKMNTQFEKLDVLLQNIN